MGLEAGRQLAKKGASIVIVARNIDNLKSGIEYITVGDICSTCYPVYETLLTFSERSITSKNATLPLCQRRLDFGGGVRSSDGRD
jgi:hypothetical protein